MRTIEMLTGESAGLFAPGVVAGLAIAGLCAALSVFVVIKRMAFIGQGVSHAAFGGVGLAAFLGLGAAATFGATAAFCVASAIGVAYLSRNRETRADTIIGIFLVASMALGAMLLALRARNPGAGAPPSWEGLLFGSIITVSRADAAIACAVAAASLGVVWCTRRRLLFWAFDETGAQSAGVRTGAVRVLMLTLLAVAIVTAMKLAGVILATALLVLPGAIALRLSRRLGAVFVVSGVAAVLGVALGLVLSFELDLPPGASIVGVLTLLYAASWAAGVRGVSASPGRV
ncbi:MAG: metal ABC transporter permease [Phycisphaeraceae bacterium]|nr:metal ABC transporter permease [Phycisphaeraceae bacterium]